MDKYAIIKSGSKQYRVMEGDIIDVELLHVEKDGQVVFSDVLFMQDGKKATLDAAGLKNWKVQGVVLNEVRGPKVIAYKYKRRKNYRRKVGHRQNYTRVKITTLAA